MFFRDLAFAPPPYTMLGNPVNWIRGREKYSDNARLQHCIRGAFGVAEQPRQKKQTDKSANYISHVGVRFLGMSGRQVEQPVTLADLAYAFALAPTSHQNHFLQTFGAKPASSAGWEWQVFGRRAVW